MRSITKFFLLSVLFFGLMGSACEKEKTPTIVEPPLVEEQPTQYDVPFGAVPDAPDVNLYEANVLTMSAGGNLEGVRARLSAIKAMGINVLWIMPIYKPGALKSVGSPYAVRDYKAVNPNFGTLDDLRLLVKEAHGMGMAVLLDWVANHTAWDNAWLQNKAWYSQDASGNVLSPNGWTDVADLNFGATAMRAEMIKAMKYWLLEANVDGFRCDYAEGVPTDFWKQAIDTLRKVPNRKVLMFAEGEKKELLTAGFDMIFGWNFYDKLKSTLANGGAPSLIEAAHATDYNGLADGKQVVRWVTNHDQYAWDGAPQQIFKSQPAVMAGFVLSAFLGGVPLVYSGQELAYASSLPFFFGNNVKLNWDSQMAVQQEYARLLNARAGLVAARRGSVTFYGSDAKVLCALRQSGGEKLWVLVNTQNSAQDYVLPGALQNTQWVNALDGSAVSLQTTLQLSAYQYVLLRGN